MFRSAGERNRPPRRRRSLLVSPDRSGSVHVRVRARVTSTRRYPLPSDVQAVVQGVCCRLWKRCSFSFAKTRANSTRLQVIPGGSGPLGSLPCRRFRSRALHRDLLIGMAGSKTKGRRSVTPRSPLLHRLALILGSAPRCCNDYSCTRLLPELDLGRESLRARRFSLAWQPR